MVRKKELFQPRKSSGSNVQGPLLADTLFFRVKRGDFAWLLRNISLGKNCGRVIVKRSEEAIRMAIELAHEKQLIIMVVKQGIFYRSLAPLCLKSCLV
ncbi:hypothetical protein HNP81_003349 [Peribacillus huizhouensis]|uniref:Uncharacterized protein n=1 Tax=Peribacillus huizhouensis TaxID=1501239 RepID=A0ABR6CTW1_9BACI|nr:MULTISPECIES: hypothetical protein [Bacillaceae]MBA9028035.1 hypothetical protein [Peribacillus huizhouensis]